MRCAQPAWRGSGHYSPLPTDVFGICGVRSSRGVDPGGITRRLRELSGSAVGDASVMTRRLDLTQLYGLGDLGSAG